MLNRVQLVGNVGKDPEVRTTTSGNRCVNFSVATSERWKDKNSGEAKERTEWHNIVVWNEGLVGVVEQYVRKGSRIYVEGKMQTRKWEDQDGKDRWSTEVALNGFDAKIILLDRKEGGGRPPAADGPEDYGSVKSRGAGAGGKKEAEQYQADLDDEIPFNRKLHKHEEMPWMP